MTTKRLLLAVVAAVLTLAATAQQEAQKREMRTVWIATVSNIDWPQSRGTGTSAVNKQKDQLIALLDGFEAANMNAVCLQVRPMADALYKSSYEPWSSYLTGTRGKDPGWDPLEFAVEQCHKRGLECHVWVNPYRFSNSGGRDCTTPQDEALKASGILMQMGDRIVFNPGLEASRQRVVNVCREMIENYDIDGIIFDDYFYPSVTGGIPTDSSAPDYGLWQQSGTTLSIADWRRAQVNLMVRNVYDMVQQTRPGVKFAIGPAGVAGTRSTSAAKHGVDPCPTGSDWQYDGIYSDPLAWLEEGTIDYISPQLYWKTDHSTNPFGPLTQWWSYVANHFGRHHYASHNIYFMAETNTQADWDEILQQIRYSRQYNLDNAPGVNFYSAKYLSGPTCTGFGDYLAQTLFTHKALTPALTWKDKTELGTPQQVALEGGTLSWQRCDHPTVKYAVYAIPNTIPVDQIQSENFAGIKSDYLVKVTFEPTYTLPQAYSEGHWYAVTIIDGWGNEFAPAYVNAPAGDAEQVDLVTPADGAVADWNQRFDWTDATDAATYRLQIAADNAFDNIAIDRRGITQSEITIPLNDLASTATYFWRVITSQTGHFDKPSAVRAFSTDTRPRAPMPTLLNPDEGEEIEDEATFECSLTDADSHTLQIAADNAFTQVKYTAPMNAAGTKMAFTLQLAHIGLGTFYWRVATTKNGCDDNVTPARMFKVTKLNSGYIEPGYVLRQDIDTYDPAGNLTLTNNWVRSVKSDYGNIAFNGDGLMNRGFTVKDGKVLLVERSEGSPDADVFVKHFSAKTGELLKTVAVDPTVKCSYYPGNDIFLDNAGNVLVSNLVLNISSAPIYLYQIDPDTGEATLRATLLTSATDAKRIDHCNVLGDVTTGNFHVFAAISNGTQVVRWTVEAGAVTQTDVMTARVFVPAGAAYFGLAPRVYPVSQNRVYVTGGSTHLTRYNFDTGAVDDSFTGLNTLIPEGTEANGAAFFDLMGKHYMLYPYSDYRSASGFRFMLAQSSETTDMASFTPLWTVPERGLGSLNSSTWDAPCCVTDGSRTNQKELYVYVPGNGIAAYTLTAGVTADVDGNGIVDVTDMNIVINAILGSESNPGADVDGNGIVDVTDMNIVINAILGVN